MFGVEIEKFQTIRLIGEKMMWTVIYTTAETGTQSLRLNSVHDASRAKADAEKMIYAQFGADVIFRIHAMVKGMHPVYADSSGEMVEV